MVAPAGALPSGRGGGPDVLLTTGDVVGEVTFFRMYAAQAEPFSAMPEPPLTHEQEAALMRGCWRPPEPLVMRRNSCKRRPGSFSYGGSPLIRLLGFQLVAALRDSACSGWETYAVVVIDEDGSSLGELAGLTVTGRCGPVDPDAGAPIEGRSDWRRGVVFDRESWDGSDVFVPEGTGGPFFSERACNAVKGAGVRDVSFERLDEAEVYVERPAR